MVSPRGSWRAHICPEEEWNFPGNDYFKLGRFCIYVNYTRDWQLGLKEYLQDSVVKPIIFTTQKSFFVKDIFNKCE